jgi:hypothetical protein
MSKFKVGDKVRCIKSISLHAGGPQKGAVFTVTAVDPRLTNYIGFPCPSYNSGTSDSKQKKEGLVPNWSIDCFELVKQTTTKHYKWKINAIFSTSDGNLNMLSFDETEHYVSPEKIENYINFLVTKHSGNILEISYTCINDKFVEDVE